MPIGAGLDSSDFNFATVRIALEFPGSRRTKAGAGGEGVFHELHVGDIPSRTLQKMPKGLVTVLRSLDDVYVNFPNTATFSFSPKTASGVNASTLD